MEKVLFTSMKKSLVDLRILQDLGAKGLTNAMIGLYFQKENEISFITDNHDVKDYLIKFGVKGNDIYKSDLASYKKLFFGELRLVMPIQRALLRDIMLSFCGLLKFDIFIHDFHFLSKRKLLLTNENFFTKKIKKLYYFLTISVSREIYCDSTLVQRQIKKLLQRNAKMVKLVRIFKKSSIPNNLPETKPHDYLIKLDVRSYKAEWALNKLKFRDKTARVAIDKNFFYEARKIIRQKNPFLNLIPVELHTDSQLIKAFQNSKVFLCLSRHEGFGYLPHEAQYFGCKSLVLKTTAFLGDDSDFFKVHFYDEIEIPEAKKIPNQTIIRERVIEI